MTVSPLWCALGALFSLARCAATRRATLRRGRDVGLVVGRARRHRSPRSRERTNRRCRLHVLPTALVVVLRAPTASAVLVGAARDPAALVAHDVLALGREASVHLDLPRVLAAMPPDRVGPVAARCLTHADDSALAFRREPPVTEDLRVVLLAVPPRVVAGRAVLRTTGTLLGLPLSLPRILCAQVVSPLELS